MVLLLERGTCAVKKKRRGAETKCVSPNVTKKTTQKVYKYRQWRRLSALKKKNRKGSEFGTGINQWHFRGPVGWDPGDKPVAMAKYGDAI